ncbi:hypothetical protein LH935_06705 [Gordonia polyisoprenivorans]|nr:hypothetical protein LH935_06705 [Gordonia polyisoprenivorans]
MPLLGYDRWENFAKAIARAEIAVDAQNGDHDHHFRDATKVVERSQGGGSKLADVELTRFAAYQVAMCGDPRKPEVAAALAYFAIRTREAEVGAARLGDPLDELDAATVRTRKAIEIARSERIRADKAEKKLIAEQQHRKAIEGGDGIDPTTFAKKFFSEVPARKFDDHLYEHGYLINQKNTRVRADGSVRNGFNHRKPTAKGRKYFYAHDNGTYGGHRRFGARIRPQMEIALRDALVAEGLPVNEHSTGLVLLTAEDMKELEA